ncbi:MAG: sigma-54 dependent transcriptional regulator [Desulfobacterales bacterium]
MFLQNLSDTAGSAFLKKDFGFAPSYARILEKTEIIRSGLRWSSELDSSGIRKILLQVSELRDDILRLSRNDRYAESFFNETIGSYREKDFSGKPLSQRKQALLERNFFFEGIFGENPALLECLEIAEKAARTQLPVLIEGESGTGKELLAKMIHANSDRSQGPYLSVNCGAIAPNLLESELFGHVKGAFTGSVKDRKGKFESAENGTIFLDEIGELPAESQVKLLRVLENGDIQRVGSDEVITVNTRIVAATNRHLHEMVGKGLFREDLYYRLSVISLTVPPLRNRRDEIPLLIDYFCAEAAESMNRSRVKLSPRLHHFLLSHSYKGNIRELRNIIYRITCLAGDTADIKDLPEMIRPGTEETEQESGKNNLLCLEDVRKKAGNAAEIQLLEDHLRELRGNVTALAKRLGMNRSYVQTLLRKHGIRAAAFKQKNTHAGK